MQKYRGFSFDQNSFLYHTDVIRNTNGEICLRSLSIWLLKQTSLLLVFLIVGYLIHNYTYVIFIFFYLYIIIFSIAPSNETFYILKSGVYFESDWRMFRLLVFLISGVRLGKHHQVFKWKDIKGYRFVPDSKHPHIKIQGKCWQWFDGNKTTTFVSRLIEPEYKNNSINIYPCGDYKTIMTILIAINNKFAKIIGKY